MKKDFEDVLMDILSTGLVILALVQMATLVVFVAIEIWGKIGG